MDGVVDAPVVVTTPDFLGPHLDLLVFTPNEIWRAVL